MQNQFWNQQYACMDPKKAKKLQEEQFLSTVRWAYAKTTFYRKKFDEAGITPDNIRSLKGAVKIPFTHKDELRQSQENSPPYGEHCALPRFQRCIVPCNGIRR